MDRTSLLPKIAYFGIFVLTLGAGIALGFGVEDSKNTGLSAATMLAQPDPIALRGLIRETTGKLTERQCFHLARKAIVEGRAYRKAWFRAGHRTDTVSPQYFAVAGKCYAMAVDVVHQRLAQGLAISQAEQARAVVHAAWWRFRSEPTSDYPKTLSDLREAAKLDPTKRYIG